MKTHYRSCELEAYRDNSISDLIYSIFYNGYEVTSGYSEGADTVREWIKDLKSIADCFLDEYSGDTDKWEDRDENYN